MAHGYLQKYASNRAEVFSAGIEAHGLNPRTVKVMAEDNVDISAHTSDKVDQYSAEKFDFIVTVCNNAKENCPYFPGKAIRLHNNFTDPADAQGSEDEILNVYRMVRDEINSYTRQFVDQHL